MEDTIDSDKKVTFDSCLVLLYRLNPRFQPIKLLNIMTPRSIVPLLFFYALLIPGIKAQENPDSLRQIWQNDHLSDKQRFQAINRFYVLNTFNNPATSRILALEHLTLARQKNNFRQTIKACNEFAIIHALLGNPDSALLYMEESIGIAEQMNDSVQLAILYMNHGNALCHNDRLPDGVKRFFESLYIFEKLNVKHQHQADINNNLGLVYYDLGLYDIALPFFEKARLIYQQIQGPNGIGTIWFNLSKTHFARGDLHQAKSYLQQAITLLKNEPNLSQLSAAYLMASFIHEEENHTDSVQHYLNLALDIRTDFGNVDKIVEALTKKLSFYLKSKLKIEPEDQQQLIKLLDSSSDLRIKADGFRLLHQLYKLAGKDALALEMLENFTTCEDTLQLVKDKFAVIRAEIQSDFNNKMQHRQLEEERAKAAADLNHLKNLFLLGSGALLIIFTIIFLARKRIHSDNLEKNRLLQEIDTLKNVDTPHQVPLENTFTLNKDKLEQYLEKKINDTDWAVLNVLLRNPVVSNKDLAAEVFLSPDGIGSSLRRMYVMFDVPESKYMKIGLLLKVIKISNN